jgi:hypothetical protein
MGTTEDRLPASCNGDPPDGFQTGVNRTDFPSSVQDGREATCGFSQIRKRYRGCSSRGFRTCWATTAATDGDQDFSSSASAPGRECKG